MRMNFPTGLAVAVAGVALGFLAAGRMVPSGNRDVTAAARPPAKGPAGQGGGQSDRTAGDGAPRTLEELEKHLRKKGVGPDIASHMERLSVEEIRSLMEALLMASVAEPENLVIHHTAIRAAARELYRREGTAALEWGRALAEQGNAFLFEKLVMAAVEDSPELAKPWVDLYQKKHGLFGGNPFREVAFRAAGKKGVDAVLEARKALGDGAGDPLVYGPLPDDFDFNRLLTEVRDTTGLAAPLKLWAGKDPDAAWQALKEMDSGDPESAARYLHSLFDGMSQTVGEDAAVKWMAARLGELPGDLREKALFSLMNTHDLRYQVVNGVMDGLPNDADRVALVMGTITPFNGDGPLDILRHLGNSSLQTDALVGAAKSFSRFANDSQQPDSKRVYDYFTKITADLNLPPEERARVMETLGKPQDVFSR